MKINIHGFEAIEMLERYYTEGKWPVNRFDVRGMYSVSYGGDGSYFVVWDIIDLKGEKLMKASDYFDAENGGCTPNGEGYSKEWNAIEDRVSTYNNEPPTAISVEALINAILTDQLNTRGHNRHLGRHSDGSGK